MTIIQVLRDGATVTLSSTELYMINNALNEVCNALDMDDFSIRMGVERADAAELLKQIHALVARMKHI